MSQKRAGVLDWGDALNATAQDTGADIIQRMLETTAKKGITKNVEEAYKTTMAVFRLNKYMNDLDGGGQLSQVLERFQRDASDDEKREIQSSWLKGTESPPCSERWFDCF